MVPQPDEVMVNDLVVLPYCADSRSDATVIPRAVVDEPLAPGCKTEIFCLPKPIEAIVAGGSTATCVYTVTVDIVLWAGAGNVHLREVTWWIMEGSETDFLFGNDTLLEQLAGDDHPEDSGPFEIEETSDLDPSVLLCMTS
ncbi:hypothetical protein PHMEG_00024145 [Phytophthora megakarya]|uniref:Uncharacterized protein n=1 Tax=Phytophthora megakarya TaxID=4795 RepID=A0A225VGD7_9STRA|nr:hypothetical protein PHMEG_00024145 [Phytophthora megakarya]